MLIKKFNKHREITFDTEMSMSGLRLCFETSIDGDAGFVHPELILNNSRIEVSMIVNGQQTAIIPKRKLKEISTATNWGDNSVNFIQDEDANGFLMVDVLWSANKGNAMIEMDGDARYIVNIYLPDEVPVTHVHAIKDDSTGGLIQRFSNVLVDQGEEKELLLSTDKGQIVGLTVFLDTDFSRNDFNILLSFNNGTDMLLSWLELQQLSVMADNNQMRYFGDDGHENGKIRNEYVFINLLAFESGVRKVKITNNHFDRQDILVTKISAV